MWERFWESEVAPRATGGVRERCWRLCAPRAAVGGRGRSRNGGKWEGDILGRDSGHSLKEMLVRKYGTPH